jgi:hypothetical protein
MRDDPSRLSAFGTVVIAAALLLSSTAALAQRPSSGLDPESGARLPYVTRADLGETGKPVADIFARSGDPGAPVSGPLAFAAYNPAVATALLDLHDGAVTQGSLDAHARELAILVACRERPKTPAFPTTSSTPSRPEARCVVSATPIPLSSVSAASCWTIAR